MNNNNITRGKEKREKILQYTQQYINKFGYPPTIREIGEAVGLSSTSTVHSHIQRLIFDGELESDNINNNTRRSRSLRIPKK